jgi:hypothetical protein
VVERIAEIVVLGEDLRQGNFVRHYLKRDGHNPRNIRLEISPEGYGSGEQFVRECYPEEVKYYRNRSSHRQAALAAAIDADTGSVADREQQLEEALKKAGEVKRKKSERIALLIPKRHIETWILCLTGEKVNETAKHKSASDVDQLIKEAAENFYQWSRPGYPIPARCVPSLSRGLGEIRRIG